MEDTACRPVEFISDKHPSEASANESLDGLTGLMLDLWEVRPSECAAPLPAQSVWHRPSSRCAAEDPRDSKCQAVWRERLIPFLASSCGCLSNSGFAQHQIARSTLIICESSNIRESIKSRFLCSTGQRPHHLRPTRAGHIDLLAARLTDHGYSRVHSRIELRLVGHFSH
jgi:hypothetical protein